MPSNLAHQLFRLNLQQWIKFNLKEKEEVGKEWPCLWSTSCSLLWMWRNKEKHCDGYLRPFDPGVYIRKKVAEYEEVMLLKKAVMEKTRVVYRIMGYL